MNPFEQLKQQQLAKKAAENGRQANPNPAPTPASNGAKIPEQPRQQQEAGRRPSPLDALRKNTGAPAATSPNAGQRVPASSGPALAQPAKPNPLAGLVSKGPAKPSGVVSGGVGQPASVQKPVDEPAKPAEVASGPAPQTTTKTTDSIVLPDNIPEEQRANVIELRTNIEYLIANIDNKEQVGDVVRNIVAKLQANADLAVFVPRTDMNAIVRGLRGSFKFAARAAGEKKEAKAKTTGRQSKIAQQLGDFSLGNFSNLKF